MVRCHLLLKTGTLLQQNKCMPAARVADVVEELMGFGCLSSTAVMLLDGARISLHGMC